MIISKLPIQISSKAITFKVSTSIVYGMRK